MMAGQETLFLCIPRRSRSTMRFRHVWTPRRACPRESVIPIGGYEFQARRLATCNPTIRVLYVQRLTKSWGSRPRKEGCWQPVGLKVPPIEAAFLSASCFRKHDSLPGLVNSLPRPTKFPAPDRPGIWALAYNAPESLREVTPRWAEAAGAFAKLPAKFPTTREPQASLNPASAGTASLRSSWPPPSGRPVRACRRASPQGSRP